jgi:hypothetical protein
MRGSAAPSVPAKHSRRLLVRLLLVSLALLGLATLFSHEAVALLLPVIRAEATALDENVSILSLDIVRERSGDTVRMRANLVRPVYYESGVVYPLGWKPHTEGWYQVNLNSTSILQAPLIFLILILSWPQRTSRELIVRMLIAVPVILILIALNTPLELLGNFQREALSQIDPEAVPPLFAWDRFLDGGGSSVLALGFAVITISLGARST